MMMEMYIISNHKHTHEMEMDGDKPLFCHSHLASFVSHSQMINIFLRDGKQTHIISTNSNICTEYYIFILIYIYFPSKPLVCVCLKGRRSWLRWREEEKWKRNWKNKNSSLFDFDIIFTEFCGENFCSSSQKCVREYFVCCVV